MEAKPRDKSKGGRLPKAEAEQLGERIVDVAERLFLAEGYGETSIETIAKETGISKRSFYHRFADKEALFAAVINRLMGRMRPPENARFFSGGTIEELLPRLARAAIKAALTPQGVALYRLIISETKRFPELATIAESQGMRKEALKHIAELLMAEGRKRGVTLHHAAFSAEQFLQMSVILPQRKALLENKIISNQEIADWADRVSTLFLGGVFAL